LWKTATIHAQNRSLYLKSRLVHQPGQSARQRCAAIWLRNRREFEGIYDTPLNVYVRGTWAVIVILAQRCPE
jgi:hypothetical protein